MKDSRAIVDKKPQNKTSKIPDIIRLEIDQEEIEVKIKKYALARTVEIKITRLGCVELVILNDKKNAFCEGLQFLEQKKIWVKDQLGNIKEAREIVLNRGIPDKVYIFAMQYDIVLNVKGLREAIEIKDNKLLVSYLLKDPQDILYVINIYLRSIIEKEAITYTKMLIDNFKIECGQIHIKHMNKELSCHIVDDLYFSWRLIFAPKYVLRGLISEELLHLNNFQTQSKYYKKLLNVKLFKECSLARNWLNANYSSLNNIFIKAAEKVIMKKP